MDVSIEEMKSCLQEWYAQAMSYEHLFEIHYAQMKLRFEIGDGDNA